MFRNDGQRNQLSMRVFQGRPGRRAVVLEQHDVLEPLVLLQVENAVAKRPQHIFNPFFGQGSQGLVVVRGLDDDFVRADAIHLVEHAISRPVQAAFNGECREFIRHHAHRPPLRVAASSVRTVSQHFRRCLALAAGAKRTESALHFDGLSYKIGWAFCAVG